MYDICVQSPALQEDREQEGNPAVPPLLAAEEKAILATCIAFLAADIFLDGCITEPRGKGVWKSIYRVGV